MRISIIPWVTMSASVIVGAMLMSWVFFLFKAHSELVVQVRTLSSSWEQTRGPEPRAVESDQSQALIALTDGAVVLEDARN